MKSRLNSYFLLPYLAFFGKSNGQGDHSKFPGGNLPSNFLGFPVYNTGHWPFLTCNQDQGQKLTQLWTDVGNLIDTKMVPDMQLGSSSPHGYYSMFSHNDPKNPQTIMQDASAHRSFSTLNPSKLQPDLLVFCVNDIPNAANNVIENHIKTSMDAIRTLCDSSGLEFITKPEQDLWMCPKFFTNWKPQNLPTHSTSCPSVNKLKTKFLRFNNIGLHNGFNILYTLARKYAPVYLFPKIHGINECLYATADKQLSNGNNYAFYGSCKFCFSLPNFSPLPPPPTQIMHTSSTAGGTLLPIFYHVSIPPSENSLNDDTLC